jgi:hypothetical protein
MSRLIPNTIVTTAIFFTCSAHMCSGASDGDNSSYVSAERWRKVQAVQPPDCLFAQQMQDSLRSQGIDHRFAEQSTSAEAKSPRRAILYALVPGFVVHGSGHIYAGEKKTARILLATEMVGFVLMFMAMGDPGYDLDDTTSNGDRENDDGTRDWLAGTGAFLFLGSWIYDVVGAPFACKRQNERILRERKVALEFDFERGGEFVRIQLVRRF